MAVDVGRFIKPPEFNLKIITYRDVFQASACEEDRMGQECIERSAAIILDASFMKNMGIKDNTNVRLTSRWGSVVVKARASPRKEQPGIGFMVNSPWSNALVSDEILCGIPEYKNIESRISITKDELTDLEALLI